MDVVRNLFWIVAQIDLEQFAVFARIDATCADKFDKAATAQSLLYDTSNLQILFVQPVILRQAFRMHDDLLWHTHTVPSVKSPSVAIGQAHA